MHKTKNIQDQLGVKNMPGLTRRAMKGKYDNNSFTKELIRTFKINGKECNHISNNQNNIFVQEDLIIIYQ